ncbi:MAG: phage tail protein [Myxococcales bacterium]|nr:phage tail protein [Myxococcales bacterium]
MLDFPEAFQVNEYEVSIGGSLSPGISKVSGLGDGEVEAIEQPSGGSRIIHKIGGSIVKFDDITLERYMDGTDEDVRFYKWFRDMFKLEPGAQGSSDRRGGSIVVKRMGEEVMRFKFEGAWVKSSKFTDLQAGGNEVMKQTVVLAVERMERVEPVVIARSGEQ